MTDPVRRLLLIKPSSLGDIVHAMPTLAALREQFPQARVTWLVKRQWAPLVEVIAGVDQVCSVSEGLRGWLGRVPDLRAAGFDLVVELLPGVDFRVPPDCPAFRLDRSHERRNASFVAASIRNENVSHARPLATQVTALTT